MSLSSVNANGGEREEQGRFRQFDVVSDDSDHHYRNKKGNGTTNGRDCFSNATSGVHKKIMKEWKLLEQNLPETIYVRVYERRIDLLRAAIVGPAGTPYHDGVFVFDLAFPPDYPTRPPFVHYRSFGLQINPNIYANGKVCLSLLNTWFGSRNEKWIPGESTVLQILVSIQGLVLNRNPYFNEPGAGRFTVQRTKKSMAYSANAFLLSCITMYYLLRRPPKNFERFISTHFRDRATHILSACEAYVNGRAVVGYYGEIGSRLSLDTVNKMPSNVEELMKSWYPCMVVAFKGTGASLGNSVEQLRIDAKTVTPSKEISTGLKKKSRFGMVIGKLKNIFRFKKIGTKKGIKVSSSSS